MAEAIVGDHSWAEMTEDQKTDAVLTGRATLKQMSEGLLDGSEKLRRACQDSLAHLAPSFENLAVDTPKFNPVSSSAPHQTFEKTTRHSKKNVTRKQRFGLPDNFVPRLQRFGRGVLLELNIYSLPDGQEFIPAHPSGTLARPQHLYALLTPQQFASSKRGSVYIRSDGRIFDYSAASVHPNRDFFDTGYTIYDLERTGRYAPAPVKKRRKKPPLAVRRAHAG